MSPFAPLLAVAEAERATGLSSGPGLWTFLLASLAVIGLAYLTTRLMTRWQGFQGKGRRLRVLEGVPIGKDRHLLLVAVGKELMVLGSAEGGVTLVHKIDDPEAFLQAAEAELPQVVPSGQPENSLAATEAAIRGSLDKMRNLLSKFGGGSHV